MGTRRKYTFSLSFDIIKSIYLLIIIIIILKGGIIELKINKKISDIFIGIKINAHLIK